jgi:hypothetical protein
MARRLALWRSRTFLKATYVLLLTLLALVLLVGVPASAQSIAKPETTTGSIRGTILDPTEDVVPNATVVLQGPVAGDRRTAVTNDYGAFAFHDLTPQVPYKITITAEGFVAWSSSVTLEAGENKSLPGIKLRVEAAQRTVAVSASSSKEIATQQLKAEEQQRILGVIPNLYVTYERHPEPLTSKMKMELAFKDLTHPFFLVRAGLLAGMGQARNSPDYGQGAEGFGKRMGTSAADVFTESMVGNAILPALLHQDPRYFYQGTGTKGSRARHAILSAFLCPGDNGNLQPNYSTWGGALISSAISTAYYPASDRSAGRVFSSFGIGMALHAVGGLAQEFILAKHTSRGKETNK